MMIAGNFAELTAKEHISLKSYEHCIVFIICNPAQPACYLKACRYCPSVSKLKERLNTVMDDNLIDSVQYKKWITVDRSTLETITKPAEDFIDVFCDQIMLLLPHSFIAKQQLLF